MENPPAKTSSLMLQPPHHHHTTSVCLSTALKHNRERTHHQAISRGAGSPRVVIIGLSAKLVAGKNYMYYARIKVTSWSLGNMYMYIQYIATCTVFRNPARLIWRTTWNLYRTVRSGLKMLRSKLHHWLPRQPDWLPSIPALHVELKKGTS